MIMARFRKCQFVHKVFVHNFCALNPPSSQPAKWGIPLEFLLEGPQMELRALSQNCEQTLQKLRTNRIMNKRAFPKVFHYWSNHQEQAILGRSSIEWKHMVWATIADGTTATSDNCQTTHWGELPNYTGEKERKTAEIQPEPGFLDGSWLGGSSAARW